MTHRLLRRVLMAALLLFVPLLTSTAFAADVKGALAYVPKDSITVVVANVDKLKKSPLFNQAKKMLFAEEPKAKQNLAKLKKETGFDVFRDMHTVVVALGPNIADDEDSFVVIAEAPMNESKMVAFVKKTGGKMEKKTGPNGSYYLLGRRKDGRMAFRGKFIIIGGKKGFEAALKKQGPSVGMKRQLKQFQTRDVFAAAKTNAKLRKAIAREDKMLGKIDAAAAGLNVSNGLGLQAMVDFLTAAPAQQIAKVANAGLKEVAGERQIQKMGLAAMLKKISVKATGRKLVGKLELSRQDVNKLTKLLNELL